LSSSDIHGAAAGPVTPVRVAGVADVRAGGVEEPPLERGRSIRSSAGPTRRRGFNVRLSEEQCDGLQELARERHLPTSTMARAGLLDRLDHERQAS